MDRANFFYEGDRGYIGYAQGSLSEDCWDMLCGLDGATQAIYRERVEAYLADRWPDEYKTETPILAELDIAFFPTTPPAEYRDWANWTGRVLVRTIDVDMAKQLGPDCFMKPFGPWQFLEDYLAAEHAKEKQYDVETASGAFLAEMNADPAFLALVKRCTNFLGSAISADARRRLLELYADPNASTWDAAHSINIRGGRDHLTFWQAVIAVVPDFPRSGGSTDATPEERWPRVPTRDQIAAAIYYAIGGRND